MSQKKKVIIDVDAAIEKYNSTKPKELLTRKILAKKLGLSYQSLVNYQGGSIPDLARALKEIVELTGVDFKELVKNK